jgi:hypothetical protein
MSKFVCKTLGSFPATCPTVNISCLRLAGPTANLNIIKHTLYYIDCEDGGKMCLRNVVKHPTIARHTKDYLKHVFLVAHSSKIFFLSNIFESTSHQPFGEKFPVFSEV